MLLYDQVEITLKRKYSNRGYGSKKNFNNTRKESTLNYQAFQKDKKGKTCIKMKASMQYIYMLIFSCVFSPADYFSHFIANVNGETNMWPTQN
jgi:hypothetical protein